METTKYTIILTERIKYISVYGLSLDFQKLSMFESEEMTVTMYLPTKPR